MERGSRLVRVLLRRWAYADISEQTHPRRHALSFSDPADRDGHGRIKHLRVWSVHDRAGNVEQKPEASMADVSQKDCAYWAAGWRVSVVRQSCVPPPRCSLHSDVEDSYASHAFRHGPGRADGAPKRIGRPGTGAGGEAAVARKRVK